MSFIKRILPYIKPYKKEAFLNIFFNILYSVFSGLSFFVIIPLLRVIFNNDEKALTEPTWKGITKLGNYLNEYVIYKVSIMANNNEGRVLLFIIALVIVLFILKNLFGYLANYNVVIVREGVLKDIRNQFYSKILELPISFYSEKRKGDMMARVSVDIDAMQSSYLSVLERIVRDPIMILVSLLIMLSISVKLTLFMLTFIPITGFIISRIGKSLKHKSLKTQKEKGFFLSLLEETFSGLKIIKGFNAETIFENKTTHSTLRLYKYSTGLQHRNNLASPVSEVLGIIVFSILLWYGGTLVLVDKTLAGEEFIGFLSFAYSILTPAKTLAKASYDLKTGNAAAERVLEIIDTETTLKDTENALEKTDFNNDISLNNVSFKYDEHYVLNNLTLDVPKGKVIALVGQSGSGKSTIANLVTRFYDIQKGAITIDGINIKDITKKSLRSLIGIVTQDAILFNDTIKNNLLLGKNDASEEEIINALKIANAWEFVKELPKGIHTNIGESGNKLSGGQKQRLSIARAVIKNPPIMILDEATSALDTESEKLVQVALENMMKNRTSIVIAHRLSTIQNADTILVMKKGRIIEQGTHQELLLKDGNYRKLVEMQKLN